jgi:hypothetical protein
MHGTTIKIVVTYISEVWNFPYSNLYIGLYSEYKMRQCVMEIFWLDVDKRRIAVTWYIYDIVYTFEI